MDKNDYVNTLKNLNLRPGKVKVKERKEEVLIEKKQPKSKEEMLNEIFVQANEVAAMKPGPRRDMQILRLSIIAEYDATNLYEKFAELTDDPNIKKVMLHVANEEKAHIGEFEFLLEHLDLEHEENENEGEDEVKDMTGLGEPPGEED